MILHYERFGDPGSPPVVILHGLFGSGENWRGIARLLENDYQVFTFDLRNHGRSAHAPEMSYLHLSGDIAHTLADLDLPSASFIGHSMGGKTAMHLALHQPELVDRLVVVDIAPRAYRPGHLHILKALSDLNLSHVTSRKVALERLKVHISSDRVRRFLVKNLIDENGGYRWQINLEAIRDNYPLLIGGIDSFDPYEGPVLFVRGDKSPYVTDSDLEVTRAYFPDADFVTLNGGHWIHVDDTNGFVATVAEFLTG